MLEVIQPQKLNHTILRQFCEKYSFYIPELHKNIYSKKDLRKFLEARFDFFKHHFEELKITAHNPANNFPWLANSSIVEVLLPDSPFIVDTIVSTCRSLNANINLIIHPVLKVERDDRGLLQRTAFPQQSGESESYVYLEIDHLEIKKLQRLKKELESNLTELRKIFGDSPDMEAQVDGLTFLNAQINEEVKWLKENFVLHGLSVCKNNKLVGPHFGLLKKPSIRKTIGKEVDLTYAGQSLFFQESTITSHINKNRQIYGGVIFHEKSNLVFAGHFKERTEITLKNDIPAIRHKLKNIARKLKIAPTSYTQKELYKIAQALPVGLMMTRSTDFLYRWIVKIIANRYATEINYSIAADENTNLVWAEIISPLDDAGKIPGDEFKSFLEKNDLKTIHKIRFQLDHAEVLFLGFRSSTHSKGELIKLLQKHGATLFSTWTSRFIELVTKKYSSEQNTKELITRYLRVMSPNYQIHQTPEEALFDLEQIEHLSQAKAYHVHYSPQKDFDGDQIKIYSLVRENLSDLVPILASFGFTIERAYTFPYRFQNREAYTYLFSVPRDCNLQDEDRKRIAGTILLVLNKQLTAKPINELVRIAGLSDRELNLVKAFCAYFYKINTSNTFSYIQRVLVTYAQFTKNLVQYFTRKFQINGRRNGVQNSKRAIESSMQECRSVLDENICSKFFKIVNAIVRTNYFLNKPEISFKIQSSLIENMPKPAPHFEIYIYSHEMEGVHLRGGAVARGGIRWSDRPDDFRTEILGLMKAQMVKNSVIVPVGSKGGFVIKNQTFVNRQGEIAAAIVTYRKYISALLDLTDNLAVDGTTIPAKNVKRFDGDDSYLVVAADKGTATFSDVANEISQEKNFWLSDAFASGGSNGYDHKKQGITAKGVWASVKRHFHEMAIDPEKYPIKVVGIGDMSGDVFGNGLLLSQTLKLVAAFNHRYIFLDPKPDLEKSFFERERLFKNGGNWNEYNPELISIGGGVYDRGSRRIELSEQIRRVLGTKAKIVSGEELIKIILRAPVDLLWNGGIGTYIKASNENNFQAGDPANDRVRIDASELRVKVIAEGGNLGLTQAARVEAAGQAVRLNTDAVDNSAGVNMSDHEVNLKILLDGLLRKSLVKSKRQRNDIIQKYEEVMIGLVLRQNYKNNLGLSLDTRRLPAQFIYARALIKFLNRQGLFERANDCIPFESDLDKIEDGDRALLRPILCALTGFAKLYGKKFFLETNAFTDPWYDRFIVSYFPGELSQRYLKQIQSHPLKREIIVTEIVNEIVNHAGLAFFQRMLMETGKSLVEIVEAYLRLTEFLNLQSLRTSIELKDEWLNANIHYEYLIFLEEKVYQITKKVLNDRRLLEVIKKGDAEVFNEMLDESAKHSTFHLPRKLRITFKILTDEQANGILNAFRKVDILEDAFKIFVNNQASSEKWNIVEYFSILQQYRVKELRKIIHDLSPSSSWEILFVSKIEAAIETMITGIVKMRQNVNAPELRIKRQKIKNIINEIIRQHTRSNLNTASFYEMLQFVNQRFLN